MAGFIGFHLAQRLVAEGHQLMGLDNLNDYYPVSLKTDRLRQLGILNPQGTNMSYASSDEKLSFIQVDLTDFERLKELMEWFKPDVICHLAAQAGVRHSILKPLDYGGSNLTGFLNILEIARHFELKHLVYASSSSVYGINAKIPFSTADQVDHPVSLYAATKKANELMAHSYSHLYKIPSTGLRFFTVYGPWGRPDMAYFSFTKAILEQKPIQVFNQGDMFRDFTYIDDIISGIQKVINQIPPADPQSGAPYKIYNIGHNQPVRLLDFIQELELALGVEAKKEFLPMQAGDVPKTWADIDDLMHDTGYQPQTSIREGITHFVNWYKDYYLPTTS